MCITYDWEIRSWNELVTFLLIRLSRDLVDKLNVFRDSKTHFNSYSYQFLYLSWTLLKKSFNTQRSQNWYTFLEFLSQISNELNKSWTQIISNAQKLQVRTWFKQLFSTFLCSMYINVTIIVFLPKKITDDVIVCVLLLYWRKWEFVSMLFACSSTKIDFFSWELKMVLFHWNYRKYWSIN